MSFRLAGQDQRHEGFCLNISGSGILFEADRALELGAAIEVHLVSQRKIVAPVTAFVEIVRCTAADTGRFRIAGTIKAIKSC